MRPPSEPGPPVLPELPRPRAAEDFFYLDPLSMEMDSPDTELALLERIREAERDSSRLTQRELARASGLSLGMTNALVRRLAERGWLSLTRLSAKSFRYALTPEGLAEVTRRTMSYLRRASRSASLYGERIEAFVMAAKRGGAGTIVLAGPSEADFVLEHACERHGIVFVKSGDLDRARALARRPGVSLVWGERRSATQTPAPEELDLAEVGDRSESENHMAPRREE